MKIVVSGGGPAGLCFAVSAKRRDAGHEVVVTERDPEGATYGWGVVYWDDLLDMLYSNDSESAASIRAASRLWREQQLRVGGGVGWLPGYGYSIRRAALLEILTERARALGVDVRHGSAPDAAGELARDADLLVAADGASSSVRRAHSDAFGTRVRHGGNRYAWLGTDTVLPSFLFAFEPTPAGWVWIHAYPSSPSSSTCIVECTESTWRRLGLDRESAEDGLRRLEQILAGPLRGGRLTGISRSTGTPWQSFTEVTNERWVHGRTVLLGDAAHTTHFSIGSGTRLAMIDAVELAQALHAHPDTDAALAAYDGRRRRDLRLTQAGARTSMSWFENAEHYLDRHGADPTALAYSMAARQGPEPHWRRARHTALQHGPVRVARRGYDTARRRYRAVRRGEAALPARSAAAGPPARSAPLAAAGPPARSAPIGAAGAPDRDDRHPTPAPTRHAPAGRGTGTPAGRPRG